MHELLVWLKNQLFTSPASSSTRPVHYCHYACSSRVRMRRQFRKRYRKMNCFGENNASELNPRKPKNAEQFK
jgi:hypothetical protein